MILVRIHHPYLRVGRHINKIDPFEHRLLSMSADDDVATDDHAGRRYLLLIQANRITNMSDEIKCDLLAAELLNELARMCQLLSTTLMQILDMTVGIKG
jgi:hypothetical protein